MKDIKKLENRIAELELIVQQQLHQIQDYECVLKNTNHQLQELLFDAQADLSRMKEVQRLLVPREIKKIQGIEFSSKFIPGQKVGGDYYDVFPIEDSQRFGIILSSTGNYGLSALVLSSLVTVAPRLEAKSNFNVKESVTKLINHVQPQLKPNDHWSLFYGVFDKKYLELEYVLFGDVVASISRSENLPWALLQTNEGPIQSKSKIILETQIVTLDPLGVLTIASVGLTKCEEGLDLLQSLAGVPSRDVHDMRNHIFFSSLGPKSEDFPVRDQTAIVMQVKDRAIRLAKPT